MTPEARDHREPRRHSRTPAFYERALAAGDRDLFQDALDLEGMDAEVALLRLHIRRLVEEQSEDAAALQAGIRLLVQAMAARHRLTGREAETLTESAAGLLDHFAAMFAPVGGEDARD